jgi:hypothetical protein
VTERKSEEDHLPVLVINDIPFIPPINADDNMGDEIGSYVLIDHKPVLCRSRQIWANWMEQFKLRRVAETTIYMVRISTVFLGLDHQWGDGPPLVFETMIFGGEHDNDQWRCSTWEEAVAQHQNAVDLVQNDFLLENEYYERKGSEEAS